MMSEMAVPWVTGVQVTGPACKFLELQNKSRSSNSSLKSLYKVEGKKPTPKLKRRVFPRMKTNPMCVPADQMSAAPPCTKSGERPQVILSFFIFFPKTQII